MTKHNAKTQPTPPSREAINIVWLKRDLRLQDHEPFLRAEQSSIDYLPIYIFEPSALRHPDSALRHQQFVYHSIGAMNAQLTPYHRNVEVFYAEAVEVFSYLCDAFHINEVFSYQESGIRATWERDKAVLQLLNQYSATWHEFQNNGVIRGISDRKLWDAKWYGYAGSKAIENAYTTSNRKPNAHPFPLPETLQTRLENYPSTFQKAGEKFAWKYLESFCSDRGKNYSRHISKPLESRTSCARISPYLAWGNLSIRQAVALVKLHPNYENHKRSFNGMLTRLKWHCHFIQKFEMECDYETRCVNRGYESMPYTNDDHLIEAWKSGTTGFPMVDACMRCLNHTGWVNFRMRAMLVSVFCHHFDCDWKLGTYHLAQLFLDYEPGIHYTQFQMQAGTTGVNTIRMYNPVKQSKDHDPEGVFIKQWVEELREFPTQFIHEPWAVSTLEKQLYGIETTYLDPVINLEECGKNARSKIWGYRKHASVKQESVRIVMKHTRNKASRNSLK